MSRASICSPRSAHLLTDPPSQGYRSVQKLSTAAQMHRLRKTDLYDSAAHPWPEAYTREDIRQQREAGKQALASFRATMAAGHSRFTLDPGVYRVDASFEADGVSGLDISAQDVEIIMEGPQLVPHFRLLGCKTVRMCGPLILDSSPFGFSQACSLSLSPLHLP